MRRGIFFLISLLSLLMCFRTAVATATSFFRGICIYWTRTWVVTDLGWGDEVSFRIDRGTLVLHAVRVMPADGAELGGVKPFKEFTFGHRNRYLTSRLRSSTSGMRATNRRILSIFG